MTSSIISDGYLVFLGQNDGYARNYGYAMGIEVTSSMYNDGFESMGMGETMSMLGVTMTSSIFLLI